MHACQRLHLRTSTVILLSRTYYLCFFAYNKVFYTIYVVALLSLCPLYTVKISFLSMLSSVIMIQNDVLYLTAKFVDGIRGYPVFY